MQKYGKAPEVENGEIMGSYKFGIWGFKTEFLTRRNKRGFLNFDFGFWIGGKGAAAVCRCGHRMFLIVDDIFHARSVGRGVGQWLSNRTSTDILGKVTLVTWLHKLHRKEGTAQQR